jgi:hypothetical protein
MVLFHGWQRLVAVITTGPAKLQIIRNRNKRHVYSQCACAEIVRAMVGSRRPSRWVLHRLLCCALDAGHKLALVIRFRQIDHLKEGENLACFKSENLLGTESCVDPKTFL